jgi:hypothetical protein
VVAAVVFLHFEGNEAARLGLIGIFALLVAGVLAVCGARKSEVVMGTIG